MTFQRPPRHSNLIEHGFAPDYYHSSPSLAAAYRQWEQVEPDKMAKLRRLDHLEGRRNWVYAKRNAHLYDERTYSMPPTLFEYFPNTVKGRHLANVADLIAQGHKQSEIAKLLSCSHDSVYRDVCKIKHIMRKAGA